MLSDPSAVNAPNIGSAVAVLLALSVQGKGEYMGRGRTSDLALTVRKTIV